MYNYLQINRFNRGGGHGKPLIVRSLNKSAYVAAA